MSVEGHKAADGENMQAYMNALTPGYFKAMHVPLLAGRDFEIRDQPTRWDDSPDSGPRVAIVNRRFAEHFFKTRGRRRQAHRLGRRSGDEAEHRDRRRRREPALRRAARRRPPPGVRPRSGNNGIVFYVRSAIGSSTIYGQLRDAVREIDNALPVFRMKTLERQLDETLQTDRLVALLSGAFGLLAAALASIGLYGVMAFVVARRRKELGIRLALGATRGGVVWMVMREVLLLVTIGLVVGMPAASGSARSWAKRSSTASARTTRWSRGLTMLLLVTVSALAGLIPAQRASRINPITALRYE